MRLSRRSFQYGIGIDGGAVRCCPAKRQIVAAVGKEDHVFHDQPALVHPSRQPSHLAFLKGRHAQETIGERALFFNEFHAESALFRQAESNRRTAHQIRR